MRLEISFAEINTLLAAKGFSNLELSCEGEKIILSAKKFGLRLRLQLIQSDTSMNRLVFTHKGDNLGGSVASIVGGGFASFFAKLPDFLSVDTAQIVIHWEKLLPGINVLSSRVSVKGSGLLVDLEL